eukprot:sb/3467843/
MAVLCSRQRILVYVVVILAVLSVVLFGVLMWSVSKPPVEYSEGFVRATLFQDRLVAMVTARLTKGVTIPTDTIVYYFEEYMTQVQTCLTTKILNETFEKQYIATRVMLKYAVSGKEAWRDLDWEYKINITGVEQKQPTWKTCISAVMCCYSLSNGNGPSQEILVPDWLITSHVTLITSSDLVGCLLVLTKQYMPEALGRVFANETFKPSAKEDTLSMIGDIKEAFSQLLPDLQWMDDITRQKAGEKANTLTKALVRSANTLTDIPAFSCLIYYSPVQSGGSS